MRTQLMRAQERRERRRLSSAPSRRQSMIKNLQKVCTFTYNTSDNVPLHHHFPGAPASWFEEYMEDMGRVVGAIIPEKSSAVRMNQEEWRIKMPVVEALFLKVQPMIDVRVTAKSSGQDYPPHVPPNVSKLYHVHTTKWKLQVCIRVTCHLSLTSKLLEPCTL
ncbi:uncharacterized protein LOC129305053 [Prosopis cineraria]|uniref:uncharacterized protein LOC129305053 n=1 Tax=Prosopis cineraria TaxID=364024 RepID=UPI00240FEDF5|nr:uncharacterized protein LOC129305053 [Prosopis cineraria]